MTTEKTYSVPVLPGQMKAHHHRSDPVPAAGFYIEGEVVWIPLTLLAEVKPQPEPGYYLATDDSDGATVLAERDGEDWYLAGQIGSVPWGAVRDNYSTFTRLVPAPEPVELPWSGASLYGTRLEVRLGQDDPIVVRVGLELVSLGREDANEMARALNAAADKAEAEATS